MQTAVPRRILNCNTRLTHIIHIFFCRQTAPPTNLVGVPFAIQRFKAPQISAYTGDVRCVLQKKYGAGWFSGNSTPKKRQPPVLTGGCSLFSDGADVVEKFVEQVAQGLVFLLRQVGVPSDLVGDGQRLLPQGLAQRGDGDDQVAFILR